MQTVLGLVIHRFDIHIKRETGCFDVGGAGWGGSSQGTAEVAHFFFLLTQHGPAGVWWVCTCACVCVCVCVGHAGVRQKTVAGLLGLGRGVGGWQYPPFAD